MVRRKSVSENQRGWRISILLDNSYYIVKLLARREMGDSSLKNIHLEFRSMKHTFIRWPRVDIQRPKNLLLPTKDMLTITHVTSACLDVPGLVLDFGGCVVTRAFHVDVVARRSIWNQLNERYHAGDGDGQQGTVDVESNAGIGGFVGVEGVRDGLTEGFKGAEDTTGTRRRLDVGREGSEDPV